MSRIRFMMVGGFLGAGKTTAIARLARHYMGQGLRVGLVTNDQAHGLVDTQALRAQGFLVGEVPGACFCCKFEDLVTTVDGLKREHQPDIVITEPVGSCTDLVATVIEPLRQLHQGEFEIAPLTVLLKPEHGLKILSDGARSGFSPEAAYIFLKQIEEADLVAINKVDKLSPGEQRQLLDHVGHRYPQKETMLLSGKTGLGFERLTDALARSVPAHDRLMDVDYGRYAQGEAELGWLNATYQLVAAADSQIDMDHVVVHLLELVCRNLRDLEAEPAHLKVMGQAADLFSVSNLVGSDVDVELSIRCGAQVPQATLFVNARAAVDPEQLEAAVNDSIATLARRDGLAHQVQTLQRFRPAPPVPTHRVGSTSQQ